MEPLVAGIELGGTKSIAVLGRGDHIIAQERVPTQAPEKSLPALAAILSRWRDEHHPVALGIGSFGPVALDPAAPAYGRLLANPKPGWAHADLLGALGNIIDGPVALHTDVTAAALAEARWGAGRGVADMLYITVGTGIGVGVIANGAPVTGALHPEAGHLRVRRMAGDDFTGSCPFHGDCLEGLAAGPALAARFGKDLASATPHDPRWLPVVDALAEGLFALTLCTAPRRIVLGGGVTLGQPHLLPAVRAALHRKNAGYLPDFDEEDLETRVVPAALADGAGPLGVLALAERALDG